MKTLKRISEFKYMPWNNGLGITAEIAIAPTDAEPLGSSMTVNELEILATEVLRVDGPHQLSIRAKSVPPAYLLTLINRKSTV